MYTAHVVYVRNCINFFSFTYNILGWLLAADHHSAQWLPAVGSWECASGTLSTVYCTCKQWWPFSIHTHVGKSFIEVVRYLFTVPGVTSFLSQRTCQDSLENFLGCQRQWGGVHDNPNVQEFVKNTQALRVINFFCKGPSRGNCRGGLKLVSNSCVTKRMNLSPNASMVLASILSHHALRRTHNNYSHALLPSSNPDLPC